MNQTLTTIVTDHELILAHQFGTEVLNVATITSHTLYNNSEPDCSVAGLTYNGETYSAQGPTEQQALENVRTLLVLALGGADRVNSAWKG